MLTQESLDLWTDKVRIKAEKDQTPNARNYFAFLKGLVKRGFENHNDTLIILCGERNSGKSSFALSSALILKTLGFKFDFYNDLFYNASDMEKAIDRITTSENTVFIYDEMIDLGYSQEAMSKINKINKKIFTQLRKNKNIYFFCIPYLIDLDKMFRNRLASIWLELVYTGKEKVYDNKFFVASFHKKSTVSSVDPDPWGIEDFQKKYLNKKKYTQKSKVEMFQKFKSHLGFLKCPVVPMHIFNEYYRLSKEGIKKSGETIIKKLREKPKQIVYVYKKNKEDIEEAIEDVDTNI